MLKNNSTQIPVGKRQFVERRGRKKDWVTRCVNIVAVVGWLCALVAFTYANKAKPGTEGLIIKTLGGSVRTYWDISMLNLSFRALLVSFFICLIGLLINMTRYRRKTDRFNKWIITLGLISLVAIVVFYATNHDILTFKL